MARAKWTASSRVEHTCGRGGHPIPKGDGYFSASPGYRGRTQYRCREHPFRESELTTSLRSGPLAAREALEDVIPTLEVGDYDGLTSALEEFASEVESYADERQQALDAWENGNSQLEDLADTANQARDDAEAIALDVEPFDEEEPDRADYDDDIDGAAEYDAAVEEWNTARDEHWEDTTSMALEAAQSIEF